MSDLDSIVKEYSQAIKGPNYLQHLATFWTRVGDTPLRAAVKMLLHYHQNASTLRVGDLGCGTGRDLRAFSQLLEEGGSSRRAWLEGCDATPVMVERCTDAGFRVRECAIKEFLKRPDPAWHLLWSNYSLVHLSLAELADHISHAARRLLPKGVFGIGFKAGDGRTVVDPADEKCAVDRVTTFFRFEDVNARLLSAGLNPEAFVKIPSYHGPDYAWIICTKAP